MDRRTLLRMAALSPLAAAFPHWAWAAGRGAGPRRLILIELSGGNDGLNTVIPYAAAEYLQLRPNIGVARDQVLQLSDKLGLNPALEALMPIWKDRQLAVVQGLGYANPNRSHFRSIEIWDTASGADQTRSEGWLTRIGSGAALGKGFSTDAVVIGRNPGPVSGAALQTVVMEDSNSFLSEARSVQAVKADSSNATLRHILKVQAEVQRATGGLTATRPPVSGRFATWPIATDLSEAARLMIGTPVAPIVKVAMLGFDTHASQRGQHDKLLSRLGEALAALREALIQGGVWNDTLVMTYSEFGRRAKENGSRGTDHGSAAPHFVMGGAVKGGLYGQAPDFGDLDNGDLKVGTDYRCLYNSVLGGWWGLPSAQIEPAQFRALAIV